MKDNKLPVIFLKLLSFLSRPGNKAGIIGDVEEEYPLILSERGKIRANLWVFFQLIVPVIGFLGSYILWSLTMFRNYLKIAVRNITRNKVYSMLNIFGLSLGMAAVILISLYIQYEFSFEKFNENADDVYRVIMEFPYEYNGKSKFAGTPGPLAAAMKDECPEVIATCRLNFTDNVLFSYGEKSVLENNICFADADIFNMFSLELLKGDPQTVLNDPYSIVVSEKMLHKLFGDEDPIGKIINYGNKNDFIVAGILKNIPENSHIKADYIVPYDTYEKLTGWDFKTWYQSGIYTYVMLRENSNTLELEDKLKSILVKNWDGRGKPEDKLFLQPILDIHLYSDLMGEFSENNDIKYIMIFVTISVLILIIACINYMNLATARSTRRGREVGVRKVVGAKRKQLVKQFLGESMLITLFSVSLSLLIIMSVLPMFNSFVERDLSLNIFENSQFALMIVALIIIVGLTAGSYPAVIISAFKPITSLKGTFKSSNKASALRNTLVVVQFSISVVLIICTLVVKEQLTFIKNKDAGYAKNRIITMTIRDKEARKNIGVIRTELKNNPNVISVSSSRDLPNSINSQGNAMWPGKVGKDFTPIWVSIVDYDFVELYEIEIVDGRNFSREFVSDAGGAFLLNEAAVQSLGFENPIGKDFLHSGHLGSGEGKIVGVMKDFHHHSLHSEIEPLYLFLDPALDHSQLSIKINGNEISSTVEYVNDIMKKFSPKYPVDYRFFDDEFNSAYRTEQKLGSIFNVFSLIAIIIASLGLFGLSSFTAEQRAKEIGIRKVFGANVSSITMLLSRDFTKWILAANIIAWPIAYFVMRKWLNNFAFRVDLTITIFIAAALIVVIISAITVSVQTVKAATANPIHSLRYE